jgi:glycosyltransferase involved in cell wall biosynthesis
MGTAAVLAAQRQRRLLILNTDLEIGGTPTVVRELSTRLHAPPAVLVDVACLARWGPVAGQIEAAGLNVTTLAATGVTDLLVVRRLITLIRQRRIDTVFSFLLHANAVAAAARLACDHVRFFQSIQTTQARPAWHWPVQRFVHHAAERVIVPSQSVARVARERARVPEEKVVVIPNGIEPDAFDTSSIAPADPRPYPIGFIGRLDPVKRVADLLHAVAMLGDLVRLHIFGDGPERPNIDHLVRVLKLEGRVTLHGLVAGPQLALRQIGLLVLPSVSEGMPMVLIEAMASGVPVIGRDVPGVRDLIVHESNGLLVPSLRTEDLATAIRRLVEDRGLRLRIADHAATRARQHFAWNDVIARYREVLDLPATSDR